MERTLDEVEPYVDDKDETDSEEVSSSEEEEEEDTSESDSEDPVTRNHLLQVIRFWCALLHPLYFSWYATLYLSPSTEVWCMTPKTRLHVG